MINNSNCDAKYAATLGHKAIVNINGNIYTGQIKFISMHGVRIESNIEPFGHLSKYARWDEVQEIFTGDL